jgi:integrase
MPAASSFGRKIRADCQYGGNPPGNAEAGEVRWNVISEGWMAAYCGAAIAVNTTCRGVEIRTLRSKDLDFARSVVHIRRSKTQAGHRLIPLNDEACVAELTELQD